MKELTAKERQIALLLSKGINQSDAAREVGINRETIRRLKQRPEWVDYLEKLKLGVTKRVNEKLHDAIEKEADSLPFTFTFVDLAKGYMEILKSSRNDFCKLKALESLGNLFGVTGIKPDPAKGDAGKEEPDVYQPAWMQ